MAFIKNIEKKCAICGNVHHFQKMGGDDSIGMRDLDTRLPGPSRNMIHLSIEKCPKCGYASTDISIPLENLNIQELKSETYLKILNDNSINFALKKFMLAGSLLESRDDKKAGLMYLKASWMADDCKNLKQARLMRSKAIKYLEKSLSINDSDDSVNVKLIIVDLYRRIGMFEEASDYAKFLLNDFGLEKYKRNILFYQIKLCQEEDILDHTIPGNYNFLVTREETDDN